LIEICAPEQHRFHHQNPCKLSPTMYQYIYYYCCYYYTYYYLYYWLLLWLQVDSLLDWCC